tara:strand:+ start:1747 stop:1941 length:195 start_codon:yes stop_codon:yes gene_type:complete
MRTQELINWLSTDIDNNNLVFDEILLINERLQDFIKNKNLEINEENNIFIMKLILFLYNHSKYN